MYWSLYYSSNRSFTPFIIAD